MNKKWEEEFDDIWGNSLDEYNKRYLRRFFKKHLAKQRTQLLARVREEVIGKKVSQTGKWEGEYTEEGVKELIVAGINDRLHIQLKKLEIISEEVK